MGSASIEAFDQVLRLHRERAKPREVYFLDWLSFPLVHTEDPIGLRFVLWQPVSLFLQYGFRVEIIEKLCEGHVVLAYLEHDAAAVARKILPRIEVERKKQPLWMASSGPQVLLHVVAEVSEDPELHPDTAEKLLRMLAEFKSAIRRGDYSGLAALCAQLSELAAVANESDVYKCIELLRTSEDTRGWPSHSAALASERVLARDWLTPEEDAAWSHL